MKVLVLGVTGMLGSTLFRYFSADTNFQVWGTLRSPTGLKYFSSDTHSRLLSHIDVLDSDDLVSVMNSVRPDVVLNCVGLIKQLADAKDPLTVLPINAMFPHRLAKTLYSVKCPTGTYQYRLCVFWSKRHVFRR